MLGEVPSSSENPPVLAVGSVKTIKLVFDEQTLERYNEYYFSIHKRAKKPPIAHPYHESINEWMIMRRQAMNALKQRWKDFMVWFIEDCGYSNSKIDKCELVTTAYYPTCRRRDVDNSVGKFIIDGLVESGMIIDDDCKHLVSLTLMCGFDRDRPRTELLFKIFNE